jgi:AcrR family transcriptional regulator
VSSSMPTPVDNVKPTDVGILSPAPAALRERLLDAAEAEITETGSSDVSLRAIARRANLSHQAPSYAFGDRGGLLTALAARGYTLVDQAIRSARDALPGTTARERLAQMGIAYVLACAKRPALLPLMIRPDLADSTGELAHAKANARDALLETVAAARSEGWNVNEPAEEVAATCWAIVHGLAVLHGPGGADDLADTPLETLARGAMRQYIGVPGRRTATNASP